MRGLGAGWILPIVIFGLPCFVFAEESDQQSETFHYDNHLEKLPTVEPILADFPEFVEPIREKHRFEAPLLIQDAGSDLAIRAWRFSYNARGIVEVPNQLKGSETAIVVVHPWGIDDGQGWKTPEPAGVSFFGTSHKNQLYRKHVKQVLNPWLQSLRDTVGLVVYSLPGKGDTIRKGMYRSVHRRPTNQERLHARRQLTETLSSFVYQGNPLHKQFKLLKNQTLGNYFFHFPGSDGGDRYNAAGFWQLPIPVVKEIDVHPDDVVIYDEEGYVSLKQFLQSQAIRHVLLAGYATDMCVCATTAGYENLSPDFNVFIVGDATLATFPANPSPRFATNASLSLASLDHFITQISWIQPILETTVSGTTQ